MSIHPTTHTVFAQGISQKFFKGFKSLFQYPFSSAFGEHLKISFFSIFETEEIDEDKSFVKLFLVLIGCMIDTREVKFD